MAITTDQLAIWRRIAPARRQPVIDARWEQIATMPPSYGCYAGGEYFCPLGLALPGAMRRKPSGYTVARVLTYTTPEGATDEQERARWQTIADEAWTFINGWDAGEITPDELVAALRAL